MTECLMLPILGHRNEGLTFGSQRTMACLPLHGCQYCLMDITNTALSGDVFWWKWRINFFCGFRDFQFCFMGPITKLLAMFFSDGLNFSKSLEYWMSSLHLLLAPENCIIKDLLLIFGLSLVLHIFLLIISMVTITWLVQAGGVLKWIIIVTKVTWQTYTLWAWTL